MEKYQGALAGFSVTSGFAHPRNGALATNETASKKMVVPEEGQAVSLVIRYGQENTVSSGPCSTIGLVRFISAINP